VQKLPGLEAATARLADVVEAKAQQLLAKATGGQGLDADAASAGGAADAGAAEAAAAPAAAAAAEDDAPAQAPAAMLLPSSADALGLRQAARPYNPYGLGCRVCWRDSDTRRILLCDGCNDEYHCYCLDPPLPDVPDDDFFCPACSAARAALVAASSGGAPAPAAAPGGANGEGEEGEGTALLAGPRLREARDAARLARALEAQPYASWGEGGRLPWCMLVLVCVCMGTVCVCALVSLWGPDAIAHAIPL
jgi:hypothetical protein